jgi:hypothetical protein
MQYSFFAKRLVDRQFEFWYWDCYSALLACCVEYTNEALRDLHRRRRADAAKKEHIRNSDRFSSGTGK